MFNSNDKKHKLKVYVSIRENGGWESWNMIKIYDYPCDDKREAEKEEDKYMMELKANMNMKRAFRNRQEYYEENKDTIKLKQNQYREDNADVIKDTKKKYYEKNKQKINEKVKC